jgi:hypothetical protein
MKINSTDIESVAFFTIFAFMVDYGDRWFRVACGVANGDPSRLSILFLVCSLMVCDTFVCFFVIPSFLS